MELESLQSNSTTKGLWMEWTMKNCASPISVACSQTSNRPMLVQKEGAFVSNVMNCGWTASVLT